MIPDGELVIVDPETRRILKAAVPKAEEKKKLFVDDEVLFAFYDARIPPSCAMLPAILTPHGYAAYAVGKWHVTQIGADNRNVVLSALTVRVYPEQPGLHIVDDVEPIDGPDEVTGPLGNLSDKIKDEIGRDHSGDLVETVDTIGEVVGGVGALVDGLLAN